MPQTAAPEEGRALPEPSGADASGSAHHEFRSFLRAAGMLAGGRQIAALAFVGVVLALPNVGRPAVVEQFLWAYYGCLIMTSVGGLGFERAAGLAAARNGGNGRAALVPLLVLRLATIPLEALGLWLVVRFVGVELPTPTFLVTVVWILGIQLQLPSFSVLRTCGRRTVEPGTWLVIRLVEAPLLLGLAAGGAGSFALVASVAIVECLGAAFAMWAVPGRWQWQSWRFTELELPWRTVSAFALHRGRRHRVPPRRPAPRRARPRSRDGSGLRPPVASHRRDPRGPEQRRSLAVRGCGAPVGDGRRCRVESHPYAIAARLPSSRGDVQPRRHRRRADARSSRPVAGADDRHVADPPGRAAVLRALRRSRPSPGLPRAGTGASWRCSPRDWSSTWA